MLLTADNLAAFFIEYQFDTLLLAFLTFLFTFHRLFVFTASSLEYLRLHREEFIQ